MIELLNPTQAALFKAIEAKARCGRLYQKAALRRTGPTPERYRNVYVARGQMVRSWATDA